MPIFIVFCLTRSEIEADSTSTTSVADALSTRPLIGSSILELTLVFANLFLPAFYLSIIF